MVNARSPDEIDNRILATLPHRDRSAILAACTRVALPTGHRLYESDEPITAVHFMTEGVASIVAYLEEGRAVEVATIGNEGMVGIAAFLGGTFAADDAFMQVPGAGLKLPAAKLRQFMRQFPALMDALHRYTQALLSLVSQSAACNRGHSIDERCARWLLMTHDRVHRDDFPLTQEFLAQMLGVRRAGVSAAAGILQRAGFIRYSRGHIRIIDRRGLESAACSCYEIVTREFDRLLPVD